MKKLVAILVIVFAVLGLSGCSSAATSATEDRFKVVYIEGTRCIVWSPYDGSGEGSQMECDFR